MNTIDLIFEIADKKLQYLHTFGYIKEGCNGPYLNKDTPVRNSSHWIVTYSFLEKLTNLKKYRDAVEFLGKYLMRPENYGQSGSIYARKDVRFDKTNGLIGQAWVIEGLVKASQLLKDITYLDQAKRLFLMHPFNERKQLWDVIDCDGTVCFDQTFNHQLWFAAAGSMILDLEYVESIDILIKKFLTGAKEFNFKIHENGLIVHKVGYKLSEQEKQYWHSLNQKRKLHSFVEHPVSVIQKKLEDKFYTHKFSEGLEEGYHLFDLYGFAILKNRYEKMEIYRSDKLKKAVDYALNKKNIEKLKVPCGRYGFNNFAYGYNSPAFEYPYISSIFQGKADMNYSKELLEFQIETFYDKSKHSFDRNCCDPETMDARIYELIRAFDILGIEEI